MGVAAKAFGTPSDNKDVWLPPLIPNHDVPITSKIKRQKIRAAKLNAGLLEYLR